MPPNGFSEMPPSDLTRGYHFVINYNMEGKQMQFINKTGLGNSTKARLNKNRYGFSLGKSFLGVHFRKRSLYVKVFDANRFGETATPVLSIKS